MNDVPNQEKCCCQSPSRSHEIFGLINVTTDDRKCDSMVGEDNMFGCTLLSTDPASIVAVLDEVTTNLASLKSRSCNADDVGSPDTTLASLTNNGKTCRHFPTMIGFARMTYLPQELPGSVCGALRARLTSLQATEMDKKMLLKLRSNCFNAA